LQNFSQAPGTSMFLHWLVGILCAFYFASFVLLLREVLRPGVLWFLRNLNDPDFNPVQEVCNIYSQIYDLFIYDTIFNLDDTPSYSASFAPIRRFTSDFWNNCLFDALGSNSHPAELHADVLALLYRQFHVLAALNNKL